MANKRLDTLLYIKLFTWFILIVVFIAISVYSYHLRDNRKCQDVFVFFKNKNNLGFVSQSDVMKSIENANNQWKGSSIKKIKPQLIENELQTNEYVKKVDIFIDNGDNLCVQVQPRNPIFRVNLPQSSYYIDSDWNRMSTSTKFSKRTLILSGNVKGLTEPRTRRDSFIRNEIKALYEYLDDNEKWNNLIDQIYVDNKGKVELVLTFVDGICKIGYIDDNLDKKMNKIKYFFKYAPKYTDVSNIKSFDFQFKNQVITSK